MEIMYFIFAAKKGNLKHSALLKLENITMNVVRKFSKMILPQSIEKHQKI